MQVEYQSHRFVLYSIMHEMLKHIDKKKSQEFLDRPILTDSHIFLRAYYSGSFCTITTVCLLQPCVIFSARTFLVCCLECLEALTCQFVQEPSPDCVGMIVVCTVNLTFSGETYPLYC